MTLTYEQKKISHPLFFNSECPLGPIHYLSSDVTVLLRHVILKSSKPDLLCCLWQNVDLIPSPNVIELLWGIIFSLTPVAITVSIVLSTFIHAFSLWFLNMFIFVRASTVCSVRVSNGVVQNKQSTSFYCVEGRLPTIITNNFQREQVTCNLLTILSTTYISHKSKNKMLFSHKLQYIDNLETIKPITYIQGTIIAITIK